LLKHEQRSCEYKHRIMGGHDLFWTHCLTSVTKVPNMRTYQNKHNRDVRVFFYCKHVKLTTMR
jgi:hypothetical protein